MSEKAVVAKADPAELAQALQDRIDLFDQALPAALDRAAALARAEGVNAARAEAIALQEAALSGRVAALGAILERINAAEEADVSRAAAAKALGQLQAEREAWRREFREREADIARRAAALAALAREVEDRASAVGERERRAAERDAEAEAVLLRLRSAMADVRIG